MTLRQRRDYLKRENAKYSNFLNDVPREDWPDSMPPRLERVLRSSKFLVQIFNEATGKRLSVNRTTLKPGSDQQWDDDISWEELQEIKRECGYGERQAIEMYPADSDIVNVANMRHLWILTAPVTVGWLKRDSVSRVASEVMA